MTAFRRHIPSGALVGCVALALLVRASLAFLVASILEVLLESQGHVLDLFAMILFGASLMDVIPAPLARLRAGKPCAGGRTDHSLRQTAEPDAAEDRTV